MKIKIAIGAMIVLAIVFYLPTEINRDITLVEVQYDNPDMYSEVSLHIEGYRYRRIFQGSQFMGNVVIGDEVVEQVNFKLGELAFFGGIIDDSGDIRSIGKIYSNDSMNVFTITMFDEGSWTYQKSPVLTGPVKNRE